MAIKQLEILIKDPLEPSDFNGFRFISHNISQADVKWNKIRLP